MINVIDIETFLLKNNFIPYCLCFYYNDKNYSIYFDILEKKDVIVLFLEYLFSISEDNTIEFYVHNLNFDGMLFIEFASKNKIKLEIFSNKTNLYWIKIYYSNLTIKIRCSYKILPLSLDKIGKMEENEKYYFPYKFVNLDNLFYIGQIPDKFFWNCNDYEKFILKKKENFLYDLKEETIKYCLQDIKITKKALVSLFKIINDEDKNVLKKNYSTPSISYYIFFNKKNYNYNNIEKNIKIKDDDFIRNSYYGGRCEVFGNIKDNEHIKYYDFSGMYGQCMKEKFHFGNYSYKIPKDFLEPGFYTIVYESKDMFFPILPHHSKNNKLIFSNGVNYGTFWFEEIIYFIENGGKVIKIKHAIIFENYDFVFDKFVDKFNSIRSKGGYYNIFGKLMINSFYGSTGLRNDENITYISYSENEVNNIIKNLSVSNIYKVNNVFILVINIDKKYRKKFGYFEKSNSKRNVSYASAITSKARIKLHKLILDVKKDNGRPLYCDTDSIFAAYNVKDNRDYILNKKWIKFYKDAIFTSPKTYSLLEFNNEYDLKIKGITQKEKISFSDFKNIFYKSENIKYKDQLIFSKKKFILENLLIEKNINFLNYDKRIFSIDKKETYPLKINTHP